MRTLHYLAVAACLMIPTAWSAQATEPEKALTTEQALATIEEYRLTTLDYFDSIEQPVEMLKASLASKILSDTDAYYSALVLSDVSHASFCVTSIYAANKFYEAKIAFNGLHAESLAYDDGYQSQAALQIEHASMNIFSHLKFISNTECKKHIEAISLSVSRITTATVSCVNRLISQQHYNSIANNLPRYKAFAEKIEPNISLINPDLNCEISQMSNTLSPDEANKEQFSKFLQFYYLMNDVKSYPLLLFSLRDLYGALDLAEQLNAIPPARISKNFLREIIKTYDDDVTQLNDKTREDCNKAEMKYLHAECRKLLEVMEKIDSTRKMLFEGMSRN